MRDIEQVVSPIGDIDDATPVSGANDRDRVRSDFLSMSAEQQHNEMQRLIREAHAARTRLLQATFRRLLLWVWDAAIFAGNAVRRLTIRLFTALMRCRRAYADRCERRRGAAALGALSDRELSDIGVHRSTIDWVVTHGRDDWPVRTAEIVRPVLLRDQRPSRSSGTGEQSCAVKRRAA